MTGNNQPPKVFISYSWDDEENKEWVLHFSKKLVSDGIDVINDRWDMEPGGRTPKFMEKGIRESKFVICICTPNYKDRFDNEIGGVGYEAAIIKGECLTGNQSRFIPILRKGEWDKSAPSLMLGSYRIDLRGDRYNKKDYLDLLKTLRGERDTAPSRAENTNEDDDRDKQGFEFVNREIELATLDPKKLHETYWQCALISAPTGYGKTRLLKRLLSTIEKDTELGEKWACRYIDMRECKSSEEAIKHTVLQITGESVSRDATEPELRKKICRHILEKLSVSPEGGSSRHILLVVDSIDFVHTPSLEWFASVLHDIIVESYADYERDNPAFIVRVLLAGIDTEAFWQNYLKWEAAAEKYRLKPPQRLALSAFTELPVQDLIKQQAKHENVLLESASIQEMSYELLYLSGGHPKVVTDILKELAGRKFSLYKDYFRKYRDQLINSYVSKVAKKILRHFSQAQDQQDIKTICIFRLINLHTLQKLRDEGLVSARANISLLGKLCEKNFLNPPTAEILFYHDDIIRRILYLDMTFGEGEDNDHVQSTHKCARSLYREWIKANHHSFHSLFPEWLFHSLQISGVSNVDIVTEWESLISLIMAAELPFEAVKQAIREKLNKDGEVKYLFRERFGSTDFSPLFES